MNLDLYLNTKEPDVRLARIVSNSDTAHLAVPSLIFGDQIRGTIYLCDGAGGYIAKSTALDLARELKIGVRGQSALALTTDFTVSGNGVAFTLTLNTNQLALVLKSNGGRGLALQFRTTSDTDGVETWLSADLTVLGEVDDPDSGVDLSPATYLTLEQAQALYSPRAAGTSTSANATGTTTLAIDARHQFHTAIVTVTGSAGTRSLVLPSADRQDGDRLLVLLDVPATAGIAFNFYTDSTGGTPIAGASRTTDDSGDDLALEFLYVAATTSWRKTRVSYPA